MSTGKFNFDRFYPQHLVAIYGVNGYDKLVGAECQNYDMLPLKVKDAKQCAV